MAVRCVFAALLALLLALPPAVYATRAFPTSKMAALAAAYEGRGDMAGMLYDPVSHDRGTLARHAEALLEATPQGALVIDDMSFEYLLKWTAALPGRERSDFEVASVVPPHLSSHGIDPLTASIWLEVRKGPVILASTNGCCAAAIDAFRRRGGEIEEFPLSDGGIAWRVRQKQ